jgi:DNA polymerase-3 subunit epsilon
MTFTFRLERLDGTPADPPTLETTELAWAPLAAKGAASLTDLLSEIWLVFGEVAPDGWFGSRARAITAGSIKPSADADPDSPLLGKVVVSTGELAMVRKFAWQAVATAGGQPSNNVSKKTDLLVCGYQDMVKLAVGKTKSNKLRRAEELRAAGEPIEILTERDFFRLLGGIETPRTSEAPGRATLGAQTADAGLTASG